MATKKQQRITQQANRISRDDAMLAALRTAERDLAAILFPPPPAADAADIDDATRRDLESIREGVLSAILAAEGE